MEKKNGGVDEPQFDSLKGDKQPKLKPNEWTIADVCFGLSNMKSTNYLEQLSTIRQAYVLNNIRI